MKRILIPILILSLLLVGCSDKNEIPPTGPAATVDFAQTDTDLFTDRDLAGTWENPVTITLSGSSASCSSGGVSIDGSTVTVAAGGTYLLTGSLNGTVVIDAPEDAKIQLVLSGAQIRNETGPAICCLEANKLFITLAPDTENSLECGETLTPVGEYEVDAALYSRCDLTLNGSGKLTVTAPGGHGITSKDDLAITGGNYPITCASQGLDANNSVRICGGSFVIDAGKDAIHAEHSEDPELGFVYISGGDFQLEAEGDGISASANLQIHAGNFTVLAGGGYENGKQHSSDGWGNMGGGRPGGPGGRPRSSDTTTTATTEDASTSMKGLKSGAGMLICGGTFTVDSADDSFHSNTTLTINGGTFTIASGDDAVHAEDTLTVAACTMTVSTCYEGLEAEYIYIQGGAFTLTCDDDGLNASGGTDSSGMGGRDEMFGGPGGGMGGSGNGAIEISGGTLTIRSSGDGLDSNGSLLISGGNIFVTNPRSGDVSVLDSQSQPVITGGTYIGLGASTMMAQSFSNASTQGVIACTVGNQSAGQTITIKDSRGNGILTTQTEYSTVLMIVSSPDIIKGDSYTVTIGTTSGTVEAS